jgi:hypothetical protein
MKSNARAKEVSRRYQGKRIFNTGKRKIASIPPITPEEQKKLDELADRAYKMKLEKRADKMEKSPYIDAAPIGDDEDDDSEEGGEKKIKTFKDLMIRIKEKMRK